MTRLKVQLVGIVLVAYLVATYLSYSTYVQGDFSIYFQAGERIREGMSIYSSEGNLYVYGPLLANILSPLTIFDQLVISRFWLISSILSTLMASWLFYRAFLTKFGFSSFIVLISILSLSFSFRNNLGNGNVMAFVLLSLVIAIRLAANSYSLRSSLTLSLVTIFVFEVKTYIALFLIAFLALQRKYLALGLSFFLALLLNLLYFFRSGSSYLE